MGAAESRDDNNESTFANIWCDLIAFITYFFVFVIVSNSYAHSRSLSTDGELEGLQSELVAANKDDEAVRRRLCYQNSQLEKFKDEQFAREDEQTVKYGE